MPNPQYAAYDAGSPYFTLVRRALGDLVDGEHFFDAVANDVVYEVLYDVAGWPRMIQGRADLMVQFRGYCNNIELQSADKLITHKTDNGVPRIYWRPLGRCLNFASNCSGLIPLRWL
jgi:ketosteroid isomerase-like protein